MSTPEMKDSKGKQQTRGQKVLVYLLSILFVFCLVFSLVPHRHDSRGAWAVKQMAQLKTINTVLELFEADFGYYPPSEALDKKGAPYCGAMKLCEAVMGKDLMGIHPKSVFTGDGTDGQGNVLYITHREIQPTDIYNNLPRKGPYLPLENANAYSLDELYCEGNTGPFDPNHFVLCDVFKRVENRRTGKKVGMPILYYKARASKIAHDVNDPNNPENIYDYRDNHALLALGVPGKPGQRHPLFENPKIFYEMTRDYRTTGSSKPFRADTFILLSAGWDGLYGTQDDVANFEMKWKSN